jgi:release factor glutamine methyltransferase
MATEIRELVREGAAKLARVADSPQLEAELLLARSLEVPRSALHARANEPVLDCDATDRYEALLTRRALGEPVAYLLGEKEFWSLPLAVTPDVLIPRPETELLVERALTHLPSDAGTQVLDLGTGSGAVALALAHERNACAVLGIDVSGPAVELARRNAAALGIDNVGFRCGDWYGPVDGERFDLIVSNPPYIAEDDSRVASGVRRFEPHSALFAGADGLGALRRVIGGAPAHLLPGGWIVVEHGDRQGSAVRGLMADAGLAAVLTFRDLAGAERCTEAMLPETAGDDTAGDAG